MENRESYCVVSKTEDQLQTELKQRNDRRIVLFYYAKQLSEQHTEEDLHEVANKIRREKNAYKNLVLDLDSLIYRLGKIQERKYLLFSSKDIAEQYFAVMDRRSTMREKLSENYITASVWSAPQ